MPIPGFLAWHAVLALLTPGLLAAAAAGACALTPRPRWLPWSAVIPAWLLQLAVASRGDVGAALTGPAATWLQPGWWSGVAALGLAALLAGAVRPGRTDDDGPGLPAWRWCLLQATALWLPLVPCPILVPAGAWLLAGGCAWRSRREGRLQIGLALLGAAIWPLLPTAAPWLVLLVAGDAVLAARPGMVRWWALAALVVAAGNLL